MTKLRAELQAFAQTFIEVCTPQIWVRWWPPSISIHDTGSAERIAAVRAGTRKVGIHG